MENSQQLATQLADYDAKRKSSVDVLNEAMSKYGVPEIRSRVSGLRTTLSNTENALNAIDPSVTGRTQGSLVTEAQRSKQVANERAPIAEQYGTFSRSLGDAQSDLSDQERAAQVLAEGQLNDYESGRQALAGRYQLATDRENEQRRQLEADRAYQLQSQEAARQAKAASAGYNFGGATASATPSTKADPYASVNKQGATNAMVGLFKTNDAALVQKTINAITSSAKNGNLYDKYKLELLQAYRSNSPYASLINKALSYKAPTAKTSSTSGSVKVPVNTSIFKGSAKALGL
jgi:site-specific DNA-cytosine methylase